MIEFSYPTLSLAMLRTSSRTSGLIGGRAGRPVLPYVPPSHELPVPADERRRGNHEAGPAVARDRPARCGEQHPGRGPRDPW
jgi:hypothetical protein